VTTAPSPVILVTPVNPRRLTPGVRLRVELDQIVEDGLDGPLRLGPRRVGRAEVLDDGRAVESNLAPVHPAA
jgi:hypothetical protein